MPLRKNSVLSLGRQRIQWVNLWDVVECFQSPVGTEIVRELHRKSSPRAFALEKQVGKPRGREVVKTGIELTKNIQGT